MWAEFERLISQLSGITLRVYDTRGVPLMQAGKEPPLCSFLMRHRKSRMACEQDCLRQLASLRETKDIVSNRCHGGLSYRIVPVQMEHQETVYVLVGKLLTEIAGSEQVSILARVYRLDADELEKNLQQVRFMSEQELDEIADFIYRFGHYIAALLRKGDLQKDASLPLREIIPFGRHLLSYDNDEDAALTKALELLTAALRLQGAAIVPGPSSRLLAGLPAGVGAGRNAPALLERLDWEKHESAGESPRRVVLDKTVMKEEALEELPGPLTAYRLQSGGEDFGRLVLLGSSEAPVPLSEFAAQILAARLHILSMERRKKREEQELAMIDTFGREMAIAPSVEQILPRALETAMHSFGARRGSILLAEKEDHRVTACTLRGSHASLGSRITRLDPDTVTYKVFSEARSFYVRDAGRELPVRNDRQFPYRSSSFVSVPLPENGHALGVMHLTDWEGAVDFSENDLSLLERLSLQTSMAVQRARLADEVSELQVQALTDSLTGIFNRRHLDASLPREIQRAERFGCDLALAFIDIDDFKSCNENLGHRAGDQVLREITACISSSVRGVDSVFRYGGEEFIVLLPETGLAGALTVAEKVRAGVEAGSFCPDGTTTGLKLTVSIGVSVYPDMARSSGDLVERADEAQREAKRHGKNRIDHWIRRS